MTAPKVRNYIQNGTVLFTKTAAATGGTPYPMSDNAASVTGQYLIGVPHTDIVAGLEGSYSIEGIFEFPCTNVAGNIGDNVWWDANGTPVGGSTTGAATTYGPAGDYWIGRLAKAHTTSQATCLVDLNKVNPMLPAWPNRLHEAIAGGATLDAEDNGKVLWCATDAATITLPAYTVGLDVVIVNYAADGGALLNIDLDNSDKFMGANLTGSDGGILSNTKATQLRCDYVHLRGYDADGILVVEKRGVWAVA